MEVAQVRVRTRAPAMAIATAAGEIADDSGAVKRRKIGNEKLSLSSSTSVGTKSPDRENFLNSPEEDLSDPCAAAVSLSSGDVPGSCCSSNGSTEKLKVADLEEENVVIETAARYNLERNQRFSIITPTNEFTAISGELDLTTAKQSSVMINSRRTVQAEKMPPAAELEEFFATAEKDLHKRFKDKYNYDIVNDIPLKGRYDWIQLKP